jgi:hydroxyacylglutathione hydrolase
MRAIADGVWQLAGLPRDICNTYLLEDVLVDAGSRWAAGRIGSQLRKRGIKLIALTHCHPDHHGAAAALCARFAAPLACHQADADVMEGRALMQPDNAIIRLGQWLWSGPSHRVDRVLRAGDEVAGFQVVETPGHTPGHISLFRPCDRLAIAGDVLSNISFLTWQTRLRLPPRNFSWDAIENLRSVVRLADLEPQVVCFGHGPPLREPEILHRFADRCRNWLGAKTKRA